tara:strand:+ start:1032 stop:1559 length:528 start_codon:yes stop_codon:yes gene_type:complete
MSKILNINFHYDFDKSITEKHQLLLEELKLGIPKVELTFDDFLNKDLIIPSFSKSESRLAIDVDLIEDEEMLKLNSEFRNKMSTTDVLSLSTYEDFRSEWRDDSLPVFHLGQIFISLDVALRQAKEAKISIFQEVSELMIHGILHLKGYDHEKDEKERELMYSLERTIFERFKQM